MCALIHQKKVLYLIELIYCASHIYFHIFIGKMYNNEHILIQSFIVVLAIEIQFEILRHDENDIFIKFDCIHQLFFKRQASISTFPNSAFATMWHFWVLNLVARKFALHSIGKIFPEQLQSNNKLHPKLFETSYKLCCNL